MRGERGTSEKGGEALADVDGPPVAAADPAAPPAIEEARVEGDDGWDALWDSDELGPEDSGEEGAGAGPGPAPESLGFTELVSRICSIDVCEVFSPPRVGQAAKRYGLNPGGCHGSDHPKGFQP